MCISKLWDHSREIGTSDIYVMVDETTDVMRRQVFNILIGKLNGEITKPYLISTQFWIKWMVMNFSCCIERTKSFYAGEDYFARVRLF